MKLKTSNDSSNLTVTNENLITTTKCRKVEPKITSKILVDEISPTLLIEITSQRRLALQRMIIFSEIPFSSTTTNSKQR